MKRRKKPILLVTVLVVLFGGVIVMSMPPGGLHLTNSKSDGPVTGSERDAPKPEDVIRDMKNHTLSPPKKAVALDMQNRKGPSIALHKEDMGYAKPVPAPGGTTESQWYGR